MKKLTVFFGTLGGTLIVLAMVWVASESLEERSKRQQDLYLAQNAWLNHISTWYWNRSGPCQQKRFEEPLITIDQVLEREPELSDEDIGNGFSRQALRKALQKVGKDYAIALLEIIHGEKEEPSCYPSTSLQYRNREYLYEELRKVKDAGGLTDEELGLTEEDKEKICIQNCFPKSYKATAPTAAASFICVKGPASARLIAL